MSMPAKLIVVIQPLLVTLVVCTPKTDQRAETKIKLNKDNPLPQSRRVGTTTLRLEPKS